MRNGGKCPAFPHFLRHSSSVSSKGELGRYSASNVMVMGLALLELLGYNLENP